MQKHNFPPYSYYLVNNWQPNQSVYIFVGKKAFRAAQPILSICETLLVLPYNSDPESFIWPVNECPVNVFDSGFGDDVIKGLAIALLRDGAKEVRFFGFKNHLCTFKRKES